MPLGTSAMLEQEQMSTFLRLIRSCRMHCVVSSPVFHRRLSINRSMRFEMCLSDLLTVLYYVGLWRFFLFIIAFLQSTQDT
jgi:hypothetical protein